MFLFQVRYFRIEWTFTLIQNESIFRKNLTSVASLSHPANKDRRFLLLHICVPDFQISSSLSLDTQTSHTSFAVSVRS